MWKSTQSCSRRGEKHIFEVQALRQSINNSSASCFQSQSRLRCAREGLRGLCSKPSWAQEGAQSAQRQLKTVPGAVQGGVKFAFRAVLAVIWPLRGVQEPSGGLQEAILDPPRDDFAPSGDDFRTSSTFLGALPKLSCAQSLCKHAASTA